MAGEPVLARTRPGPRRRTAGLSEGRRARASARDEPTPGHPDGHAQPAALAEAPHAHGRAIQAPHLAGKHLPRRPAIEEFPRQGAGEGLGVCPRAIQRGTSRAQSEKRCPNRSPKHAARAGAASRDSCRRFCLSEVRVAATRCSMKPSGTSPWATRAARSARWSASSASLCSGEGSPASAAASRRPRRSRAAPSPTLLPSL